MYICIYVCTNLHTYVLNSWEFILIYMYTCIYVYMYAPTSHKVRRTRSRQTLDARHFPLCIHMSHKSDNSCLYVCIYVYMYICIYVYMYICIYVYMYICIHPLAIRSEEHAQDRHWTRSISLSAYVWLTNPRIHICIYVYMYICIYVCTN